MASFKHTGRVNPVPDGLVSVGPIVKVTLLPHPADVDKMLAEGVTPKGAIANMMVDTGATRTLIDDSIAQDLGLKPLRLTPII
ncbi:MAG: aspartyl protease family protein [Deltaproteobacteria bacterium]|nr:aspartyl protease family protein [Deltaproteobacteria bacterium]